MLKYRATIVDLSYFWCMELKYSLKFVDAKTSGSSSLLSLR